MGEMPFENHKQQTLEPTQLKCTTRILHVSECGKLAEMQVVPGGRSMRWDFSSDEV